MNKKLKATLYTILVFCSIILLSFGVITGNWWLITPYFVGMFGFMIYSVWNLMYALFKDE